MSPTRRDFLKIAAMLSGSAAVSGVVPDSIQRAFAIDPAPGSTWLDAEHIVILMQENRSFDHTLGTLQGVRGFNDPRAIQQANGNSVFVQTDAAGDSYAPWRLDIRDTRITWMGSIPHSRNSQVDAWNDGHHNGWLEAKRSHIPQYADLPLTMGHYTREDLPFYYALADAFTVCDQHFCSAMTSTSPNRSYFWTGTIRDQQSVDSLVYIRNEEIERDNMIWKTYPERLQAAGINWKFYQNELTHTGVVNEEQDAWLGNYGCNVLENFAAYNIEAYPGCTSWMQKEIASLEQEVEKLRAKRSKNTSENNSDNSKDTSQTAARLRIELENNQSQIEKLKSALGDSGQSRYEQLTQQQRALHDAAFVTNTGDPNYHALESLAFEEAGKPQEMMVPRGDVFHQFRQDVNEGKLPTISWLTAPEKFSDHPSSPWYGAWYVSEVMDILTKNPEVWKKTIFILTYDENDGYFDHAPSFVAADPKRPETGGASPGIGTGLEYTYAEDELRQGVSEKDARSGPIGMGFRVPMIVASPWSRGGWVNSQLFDHTSTLMFLEQFVQKKYSKTVHEENISAWRRSIAGDLTSVFRPHDAKEPTLSFLDRDKFVVTIQQARDKEIPSNYRKLNPAQIAEVNNNPLHSSFTSHQERGIRPSSSLPYELYADCSLNSDRTKFQLRMKAGNDVHGNRSAGSPFNVYLRNTQTGGKGPGNGMTVATYAVKPGDELQQEFPLSLFADGRYSIEVHAPNGFYRSFKGDSKAQALEVQITYEQEHAVLTGNVQVLLHNTGDVPHTISLRDNAYKSTAITRTIAAGQQSSIVLNLNRSHGWYDFTVTASGPQAEARFAGRVETGRSSFSDPLMGGVV